MAIFPRDGDGLLEAPGGAGRAQASICPRLFFASKTENAGNEAGPLALQSEQVAQEGEIQPEISAQKPRQLLR